MKENVYQSGAWGFSLRLLAYDEAEGCKSQVAQTAFQLSKRRERLGYPVAPVEDWENAEIIVRRRFAREITRRLA
jgi:hypothetical protein